MTKTWHHECRELGRGLTLGVGAPCMHCKTNCAEENAKLREQLADCTRSHPHENMTKTCELRTEIARLTHSLAVAEEALNRTGECLCYERTRVVELIDRAEAAETKLKAASVQEPVSWAYIKRFDIAFHSDRPKLYAAPVPPADVQELQNDYANSRRDTEFVRSLLLKSEQRIAELERKLAEQQAVIDWFNSLVAESSGVTGWHLNGTVAEWGEFAIPNTGEKELNTLRAQARDEGRKEAVPEAVPNTLRFTLAFADKRLSQLISLNQLSTDARGAGRFIGDVVAEAYVMLLAAPTPGEK